VQRRAPAVQRAERVRPSYTPRSVQVDRRASAVRPAVIQRQQARERRVDQREAIRDQRQAVRDQRQVSRDRFVSHADDVRRQIALGARPDRQAPPRHDYDGHHAPRWHSDWRHDHRYDWRNHRRHHRSLFHLGVYFDPFGWGYHRWNIGWRLWPSYYSSNYWLNDPYMYRLPYAPFPYKWVRYYDDAILVNIYSGQVADVIYDFFW
jgi:Ni/Co efflux regulator RcnB